MKVLIKENKLQSIFNGIMSEYSDLDKKERDYDYYDGKRGSYIDYTPINFYNNSEYGAEYDDWWESDDWVFQYAIKPPYNEPIEGFETPLLLYPKYRFMRLITMFGNNFEGLLKEWFETTYGYPVKQVISDYESYKFLRF
jgi:hypothetical protein